ncbi:hypothetical protein E4U43_002558 [Claviceps pusilla]|uniref:Uncharacterized protein n=1 Tax=Claviceps pusilla TaxID=123648 RepID=A0A9P7N629_9HYPO|nr:hypothetical protein E4U43_002558 [Claviceps pusilla]
MEPASIKLADAAHLLRCTPVANYSYPRKSPTRASFRKSQRSSSQCSSNTSQCHGRESLGSEESAPELMEDRADSEVSYDDDDQYLAHMTELWDSFWRPQSPSKPADCIAVPSEQYPALIPSPKKRQPSVGRRDDQPAPAWPLLNSSSPPPPPPSPPSPQRQPRQVRYSAFPKPASSRPPASRLPVIPTPAACRHPQMRPQSSSRKTDKPLRPPRPREALLTPCIQRPSFVPVSFVMSDYTIQKNEDLSPISSVSPSTCYRPAPFDDDDMRGFWYADSPPNMNRPHACTIYSVISQSATHLPVPEIRPSPSRTPRHSKSIAALPRCHLEQEPHSVFEDDSDDEVEECHGKKFFSFHKRSHSEHKRCRTRANTISLVVPTQDEMHQPLLQHKRHGKDVFGRLLGRRSR